MEIKGEFMYKLEPEVEYEILRKYGRSFGITFNSLESMEQWFVLDKFLFIINFERLAECDDIGTLFTINKITRMYIGS